MHHAIPERHVVTQAPYTDPACTGPDAVTLDELRATYFRPHGDQPWHYAVFAHRALCPDGAHCSACPGDAACGGRPDPTASGFAEVPGLNFAVTFGPYSDAGEVVPLATEAATLMHELGHNLGLLHGGDQACVTGFDDWSHLYATLNAPGRGRWPGRPAPPVSICGPGR